MTTVLFLKGSMPSFKNSKQLIRPGLIINSKTVRSYLKEFTIEWINNKESFRELVKDKEKPYLIGVHFVRKTRAKFDQINMLQGVFDLMKKYEWVDDDNVTELYPMPLLINDQLWSYNKDNPGIYITVYDKHCLNEFKYE